jgi:hypothetical protein
MHILKNKTFINVQHRIDQSFNFFQKNDPIAVNMDLKYV